jgi:hypothetical protein
MDFRMQQGLSRPSPTNRSHSRLEILNMSKMCGDTARYHRIRKQRARMRARVQELRVAIEARKAAVPLAEEKPKSKA